MSSSETDGEPTLVLSHQVTRIDENGKTVFKPSREFYLAFAALMAICLAVALDATTLGVALPTISSELGGTALEAFWSGTSFLLASAVLQPTVSGLSHIFGRKYLIYICCLLFGVGSLVGALAHSFSIIIVGRTIQGIGGGGLIALSEIVVTDLVPLAVRGQWFSLLSAIWAIGTVTGPLIGAGFAQNVSWRWIFWINLPVVGLGVVMVFFFLNQAKLPGHIVAKLQRFDWLGSFLFTAGSTAFLFGISTGGVMYEWSSFRVLLPLILGFAIILFFGYFEARWAKEPMINKGIFNNWAMVANYIMTIFHGAILWSLVYFLTLYYQGVKFYSPITSALAVLPETLTVAPAGAAVGILSAITGRYRWSLWTGWFLTTLGAGLLYILSPSSSVAAWIWLNIPIGIGTGMLFPAMALSIQAACDPGLNAQAAAFFSFLRTFGQSIGVAISGVIFQNVFKQKLLEIPAYADVAGQFSRDATIVVETIKRMHPGELRDELVAAYNDSLRMIWVSMIAFAGFCLILSATVKGYSLQQEHITNQALVKNDKRASHIDVESGLETDREKEKESEPQKEPEKEPETDGTTSN